MTEILKLSTFSKEAKRRMVEESLSWQTSKTMMTSYIASAAVTADARVSRRWRNEGRYDDLTIYYINLLCQVSLNIASKYFYDVSRDDHVNMCRFFGSPGILFQTDIVGKRKNVIILLHLFHAFSSSSSFTSSQ